MANDPTTKSPTFTVCTASPISSTTPTYSCPIRVWSTGSTPRYGHRSDPQMQVAVIRMIASVGPMIFGSCRATPRTSPGPYITAPRMVVHFCRWGSGAGLAAVDGQGDADDESGAGAA